MAHFSTLESLNFIYGCGKIGIYCSYCHQASQAFVTSLDSRTRHARVRAQSCLTLCNPVDCSLPGSTSTGFSRPEYWSRLPFPPPGDLPDPEIKPVSPALQADSLPLSHLGSIVATEKTTNVILVTFFLKDKFFWSWMWKWFVQGTVICMSRFSPLLFPSSKGKNKITIQRKMLNRHSFSHDAVQNTKDTKVNRCNQVPAL